MRTPDTCPDCHCTECLCYPEFEWCGECASAVPFAEYDYDVSLCRACDKVLGDAVVRITDKLEQTTPPIE